ncbi:transporter substrate-binding domain-containing protein [Aeromonas jandaei]|uniref:transporter substrate-binding domain-containing protein n=1 Tax=Aeromonas jandaei TaxID=650 RepID=UPI001ABF9D06|nr:transporter substrate-binding domain-containing protein [Aeromonas jandaei]QSR71976.1 amino acid ABC transporter substrate-binding protein [Aeromonas jandaei]
MRIKSGYLYVLFSAGLPAAEVREVLITGELPPYATASAPLAGLSGDIVTVLNSMGYDKIQLSFQPWPRGLKNLELGNALAAFPFTWTAERGNVLTYSVPITFDVQSWYTLQKNRHFEHGSWFGYSACIPKGWFSDAIDEVVKTQQLQVRVTNRLSQCVELLKKGKVDLISINDASQKILSIADDNEFYRLSAYRQNVTFYLVSPKNPQGKAFIEQFNQAWIASPLALKWR